MMRALLPISMAVLLLGPACSTDRSAAADARPAVAKGSAARYPQPQVVTGKPDEFPVRKTDAEWKKQLTPAQYYILRQQGTEKPFSSKLTNNHEVGDYFCAADHNLLFHASEKFDSGTGWPSFWAPASKDSVKVTADSSLGMSRDEILCASCGGHLGHVFSDGPAPTGKRYCIDGDALTFEKK